MKERITSKSSTVAAGGNLSLLAGVTGLTPGASASTGHASVVGSNLVSGKDLTVAASGNVNVASAQNSSYFSHTKSTVGALGLSSSSKKEGNSSLTQVASNLVGQNVTLDAGKSVSLTASNLNTVGNINLTARDGDVAVVDGKNQSTSWYYKKQTGFGLGGGGSFASFYGTEGKKEQSAGSTSKGSALAAGQDITLTASRDAAIVGSSLSAGNNVTINAGRDANILGGASTSSHSKEKFASGFGVEGILGLDKTSFFMGYQETAKGNAKANTQNAASQITASNDITVNAGQNVNMSGSRLAAAQDLNMAAGKDINLLQATDTASASAYEKTLRAGLSLELTQNLTSTAKKAYTTGNEAVSNLNNKDIIGAGEKAYDAYNSAQALANPNASASLPLGVSSSWSSSQSHSATAVPDQLSAGTDMTLAAGQDINMQGTQAQAGKDMNLVAGRDLNIHAAHSSQSSSSDKGGINAGLGVSASVNKSGYTLGVNGSLALNGEQGDSSGLKHDNATLVAGEKLTTVSGQDTTVAGANLTAKDVDMTVGRDLTVTSLKDSSSSHTNSYNAGASATVGYGADVSVTQGANLGFGFQNSNGKAVGEQTSILGSDSVNIYTENNTHVAGAIIAALNDNLKLDTGTLSYENIVSKTTEIGMSAGIKWGQTFKPGDTGAEIVDKKNDADSGKNTGQPENSSHQILYNDAKPWMKNLVDTQQNLQDWWKGFKGDTLHNISPDKFSYNYRETTQTAYATIGKGEIIVRDNLSQDLDGLNRDPSQAMKTEQTTNVNISLDPAFTYVDTILNPNTTTNVLNTLNELSTDPGGFFKRIFTGLFGGDKDKGKDKKEDGASQPTGEKKPTAAEQALQGLGNDPMAFLHEALGNMFANPPAKKDTPVTPTSDAGR